MLSETDGSIDGCLFIEATAIKLLGANSLLSYDARYLRMRPSGASPEGEFAYRNR
jgi:hypothetical protein